MSFLWGVDLGQPVRIAFVYFDAGGGHRSAMEALCEVVERQRRPWTSIPVDFQQILLPYDPFHQIGKVPFSEIYTRSIGTRWTALATPGIHVLHAVIRARHKTIVKVVSDYWRKNPVDLVVSVIPNFNRHQSIAVREALPGVPFVTLITDFADLPHMWMDRESEYVICGTERAVQQARALGHDADHVFATSGMIVRPQFYDVASVDRASEHRARGLDPDLPTGLVLFGGGGSSVMLDIAERLEHYPHDLQLIFICGRNQAVADRLRSRKSRHRFFVEGFTREVARYMRMSDFLIGKPGPGCISEALACEIPVIVECNLFTLPQERYNAQWVSERKLGIVVRSFGEITSAVAQLLKDPCYRNNARQVRNRALFEVPDILQTILERHGIAASAGGNRLAHPLQA